MSGNPAMAPSPDSEGALGRRAAGWNDRPADGGVECFHTAAATELNRARLAHLDSLSLPWNGKRVLDVGCGVGELTGFF